MAKLAPKDSSCEVGEFVIAIGSPFGLSNTSTSGIISAVNRVLPMNPGVRFYQTDATMSVSLRHSLHYSMHFPILRSW